MCSTNDSVSLNYCLMMTYDTRYQRIHMSDSGSSNSVDGPMFVILLSFLHCTYTITLCTSDIEYQLTNSTVNSIRSQTMFSSEGDVFTRFITVLQTQTRVNFNILISKCVVDDIRPWYKMYIFRIIYWIKKKKKMKRSISCVFRAFKW